MIRRLTSLFDSVSDFRSRIELNRQRLDRKLVKNKFKGKSVFKAEVISGCDEVYQKQDTTDSGNLYFPIVVRVLEIHDALLESPKDSSGELGQILTSAHPIAYGDRPWNKKLGYVPRVGQIVDCYYSDGPRRDGRMRGLYYIYPQENQQGGEYSCAGATMGAQAAMNQGVPSTVGSHKTGGLTGYVGGKCKPRSQGPATKEQIVAAYPKSAPIVDNIISLAAKMNVDPGWIANSIAGESNFDHTVVNSKSGATGLIQFMPKTAKSYGTTTTALKNMTIHEQWVYVERYLIKGKGKVASQIDLSMRIFYPVSMGKGPEFNIAEHWAKDNSRYKRYSGSTDEEKMASAMDYFASVNGGIRTKADYYSHIIGKRRGALPDRYCDE